MVKAHGQQQVPIFVKNAKERDHGRLLQPQHVQAVAVLELSIVQPVVVVVITTLVLGYLAPLPKPNMPVTVLRVM